MAVVGVSAVHVPLVELGALTVTPLATIVVSMISFVPALGVNVQLVVVDAAELLQKLLAGIFTASDAICQLLVSSNEPICNGPTRNSSGEISGASNSYPRLIVSPFFM